MGTDKDLRSLVEDWIRVELERSPTKPFGHFVESVLRQ